MEGDGQPRIPWDELKVLTWDDEDTRARDILVMVSPEIDERMNLAPLAVALFKNMGWPAGVGLAAPQIGVHARAIAVHYNQIKQFVANPVIEPNEELGKIEATEGCLSFPGREVTVPRWREIVLTGFDENWEPIRQRWQGFPARIFQHEVDHLDGITMLDRSGHWRRTENEIITAH